jgi:hypothetical protein
MLPRIQEALPSLHLNRSIAKLNEDVQQQPAYHLAARNPAATLKGVQLMGQF